MKQLKILITTDCFLPRWDGIARFLSELLPQLSTHKVTVVCPAFPGKAPRYKGVRIVRLPLMNIRFGDIQFAQFQYFRIKKLVREHDVVFNQTIGTIGMSSIMAGNSLGKQVISYVHTIDWELASHGVGKYKGTIHWSTRMLARWLYNKCSTLITSSKDMEDILTQNKITPRKVIIPLGINTQKFKPATIMRAKKNIGIKPELFVIGYHGRIAREKNLPTLVAACQRIHAAHENMRLMIIGEGVSGEVPYLPWIIHAGKQDNVVPYLQALDAYVLPSLTETSSMATMEAMAVGLPVVVTPVGSIRDYVADEVNGLVFARQDIEGLIVRLVRLMENPELRKKLGNAARKTILAKRQWKKTTKAIVGELRHNE